MFTCKREMKVSEILDMFANRVDLSIEFQTDVWQEVAEIKILPWSGFAKFICKNDWTASAKLEQTMKVSFLD
jgi:hypothetical protein